jgi:hypothetical protein
VYTQYYQCAIVVAPVRAVDRRVAASLRARDAERDVANRGDAKRRPSRVSRRARRARRSTAPTRA